MLQTERHFTSARLDALDLALSNLELLWPAVRMTPTKPRSVERTPRVKKTALGPVETSGDAGARRELLLTAIGKSDVGLTRGEIQARFPKMSDQDQRNGLQTLKEKGQIKRAGNSWVKV